MPATLTATRTLSAKQDAFIRRLYGERYDAETATLMVGALDAAAPLTPAAASALITALMARPRVAVTQTQAGTPVTEVGMYRKGEDVFKVQRSRTSGALYAKRLTQTLEGEKWGFDYAGSVTRLGLTAEDKMTLEQAVAFGVAYGVCCNCGALLTAKVSVEAGIGPICAGRF